MPDRAVAPFARGRTFYHGKTVDSSDLPGNAILGQVHVFQDTDPSDETKHRSNGDVVAIAVRNVSGIALLPKRVVVFKSGTRSEVDGYCSTANELVAGVVDDHLPAAGCPDDDICWVIVKGPCLVQSSTSNLSRAVAVNSPVYAQAAATSQAAATAGFFNYPAEAAITGDAGFALATNMLGRALTARVVASTNTDTLIHLDVGR